MDKIDITKEYGTRADPYTPVRILCTDADGNYTVAARTPNGSVERYTAQGCWLLNESNAEDLVPLQRKPKGHLLADLDLQEGDVVRLVERPDECDGWEYPIVGVECAVSDKDWFGVYREYWGDLKGRFEVVRRAERKPEGLMPCEIPDLQPGDVLRCVGGGEGSPYFFSVGSDYQVESSAQPHGLYLNGVGIDLLDGRKMTWRFEVVCRADSPAPVEKPETVWVYAVLYDDGSMGDPNGDKNAVSRAAKDSAFSDTNKVIRWQAEVVPLDD